MGLNVIRSAIKWTQQSVDCMEIEDLLHMLAPGETITVEKIASETSLSVEEVERKLTSMVKADPNFEMIVTAQGTFIQVKHLEKVAENSMDGHTTGGTNIRGRLREYKAVVLLLLGISAGAFVIGGFFGTPGEFSVGTGATVAVIAFFVLLFLCYCENE